MPTGLLFIYRSGFAAYTPFLSYEKNSWMSTVFRVYFLVWLHGLRDTVEQIDPREFG